MVSVDSDAGTWRGLTLFRMGTGGTTSRRHIDWARRLLLSWAGLATAILAGGAVLELLGPPAVARSAVPLKVAAAAWPKHPASEAGPALGPWRNLLQPVAEKQADAIPADAIPVGATPVDLLPHAGAQTRIPAPASVALPATATAEAQAEPGTAAAEVLSPASRGSSSASPVAAVQSQAVRQDSATGPGVSWRAPAADPLWQPQVSIAATMGAPLLDETQGPGEPDIGDAGPNTLLPGAEPASPRSREIWDVTPLAPVASNAPAQPLGPEPAQAGFRTGGASGNTASSLDRPQRGSRPRLMVHLPAGANAAETARIDALLSRVRPEFSTPAAIAQTDLSPVAIIRYADPADHAKARAVASSIGSLGYAWRIERDYASSPRTRQHVIELWIPGRAVEARRSGGHQQTSGRGAGDATPAEMPRPADQAKACPAPQDQAQPSRQCEPGAGSSPIRL
jgi:hypothetical protein